MSKNTLKLHNAAWPGVVGKEDGTDHPSISLDTMLDYTAAAEVDGRKFDGIDLFLFDPHVSIEASDEELKILAEKVQSRGLVIGSLVAPVWTPTGGGSAMGNSTEREAFLGQVKKAAVIASKLEKLGVRPYGILRIDSSIDPGTWAADPATNTKRIAQTFREAGKIAAGYGQRLAAEGEICWGAMHGWEHMLNLLEETAMPQTVGFQADMAHTLLYTLGYNAPENRLLPPDYDWSDRSVLDEALKTMTAALRPWMFDFHVAQNDATVHGTGSHDKTGRHCLANDPNGKLDIPHHAGFWLNGENGSVPNNIQHICWDGCMFPNEVMAKPDTWNDILATMIHVINH